MKIAIFQMSTVFFAAGMIIFILLFLQKQIYLAVLKGSVKISGYVYQKDASRQFIIREYTEVFV